MTYDRTIAAKALAAVLTDAVVELGETATVFDRPPSTLNPPAIVVGRETEVLFSTVALGIDDATLPVLCVGAVDGDDRVAELIAFVRVAIADPTLGGAVQIAYPTGARNWRQVNSGGADVLVAEVTFTVQM